MDREKSNSGIGLDLLANKDKTKKTKTKKPPSLVSFR